MFWGGVLFLIDFHALVVFGNENGSEGVASVLGEVSLGEDDVVQEFMGRFEPHFDVVLRNLGEVHHFVEPLLELFLQKAFDILVLERVLGPINHQLVDIVWIHLGLLLELLLYEFSLSHSHIDGLILESFLLVSLHELLLEAPREADYQFVRPVEEHILSGNLEFSL